MPNSTGSSIANHFPKVLLINAQPISRRYATGIAMGNLFRGWPVGRIAQVYLDDSEPDATVCPNSRHLGIQDLRMPEWLRQRVWRQVQLASERRASSVPPALKNGGSERRSWTIREAMKKAFLSYTSLATYPISPALDDWIKAFKPDLIYSMLESPHVISLVKDASRKYGLNAVPHFMDDWITISPTDGVWALHRCVRRRAKRITFSLMNRAPARLVIGDEMSMEYERRYGGKFYAFMNCVDLDTRPSINPALDGKGVFCFGSLGALHRGRSESLRQVANALVDVRKRGLSAEIVMYQNPSGSGVPDDLLSKSLVRLATPEENARLETTAATVDAFLHLDTFDPNQALYFSYSLSAKIPWCLAAGIPMFAYGPQDVASIRYLNGQQCAFVVTRQSPEALVQALWRFIRDKDLRARIGERARSVAVTHHDARIVRERFRSVLAKAAEMSSEGN